MPPQFVVDYLDAKQATGQKYPLNLLECQDCSLVQLDFTFPREKLYHHYYYHSGTSERQRAWLKNVVDDTVKRVGVRKGVWLDIGSNDSTLLNVVPVGWVKVGFEPASNLIPKNPVEQSGLIFNDFFTAKKFRSQFEKADVITCCAVFYDVDEPHVFLDDVRQILADDGLFVVQMNYLPSMLTNNSYDNISHEHIGYYSLRSFEALLAAHNLQAIAVELNEVNGGSFRVYVKHAPEDVEVSVNNLRSYENSALTPSAWREFRSRVEASRDVLVKFLKDAKKRGKTIWVYGASNRGGTILQYCNIGPDLITAAADRNPQKHGRRMVTGVRIASKELMRNAKPDYLLMLPYFYLSECLMEELDYMNKGGKFIVPLPTPRLIQKHGKEFKTEILK